jgi:hypothetical protein
MKRKIVMDSYLSDESDDNYNKRINNNRRKDSIEGSVSDSSYRSSVDENSSYSQNANNRKLVLKDHSKQLNNNYVEKNGSYLIPKNPEESPYEDLDKYEPDEISNDMVFKK